MYAIYDDVVYQDPAVCGRATAYSSFASGKSSTLSSASPCSLYKSSSAAGSSGVLGLSTLAGSNLGLTVFSLSASCCSALRMNLGSGYDVTKRLKRGSDTISLTESTSCCRESLYTVR